MTDITANINLNTAGLTRGARETADAFERIGRRALQLNNMLQAAQTGLTAIGNLTAPAAALQDLSTGFRVLIGDADRAAELLGDIRAFAAATPMETQDLAAASQQLLAYGFAADEIMGTLKTLGEVAAATNQPIGDLAYLFGTLRVQGRVMAQDINQFTNRGIPVIAELAKVMGVAEGEIRKLVEQGKVGFPQVQQAFQNMTGEGGKFAGMLAAKSQTWNGLLSTLRDNINSAMIALGQPIMDSLTPVLVDIIGNSKSIVRTFGQVGGVIANIARAFTASASAAVQMSAVLVPALIGVALHATGAGRAVAALIMKIMLLKGINLGGVAASMLALARSINPVTVALTVGTAGFMVIKGWTDKLNAATDAALALGAAADKQRKADAERIATIADEAARLEMLADKTEELARIREEAAEAAAKPGDAGEKELVAGGYAARVAALELTIARLNALTPAQMAAATSAKSAADAAREHAAALREQEKSIGDAMKAYSDHLRQARLSTAKPQQRLDLLVSESGQGNLTAMLKRIDALHWELANPSSVADPAAEARKASELQRLIGLHKEILAVQREIASEAESRAEKEKREAEALAEKAKANAAYRDRYRLEAKLLDARLEGDEQAIAAADRALKVSALSDQLQASGGLGKSAADKIAARQVDKEIGLEKIGDLRQSLRSLQALPAPELKVIANSARSLGLGGFATGNQQDVQREIARRHAEGNRLLGEIKSLLGKLQPSNSKPVEVFSL